MKNLNILFPKPNVSIKSLQKVDNFETKDLFLNRPGSHINIFRLDKTFKSQV